jgi:hypothetical protein
MNVEPVDSQNIVAVDVTSCQVGVKSPADGGGLGGSAKLLEGADGAMVGSGVTTILE